MKTTPLRCFAYNAGIQTLLVQKLFTHLESNLTDNISLECSDLSQIVEK